jgi:shikimate dehydrogenase
VIGDPIAQSKSPIIHTRWLAELGLDGRYDRCHVRPEGLADYLAVRRHDPDWRGCNVTIPHKRAVLPLLDRVDPAAARIGAINTILREPDGTLTGHNTDFGGFLEPLRPLLAQHHLFRMARIIGAGGAARAIAWTLADQGFTLAFIARDPAKAGALLREIEPAAPETMIARLADWARPTDFAWDDRSGVLDLVVNATSLGMSGQPPLEIDFSHIPPGAVIYDAVYIPRETRLLAEGRARGHHVIDGLEMLIGQAGLAFEKFFGRPAPRTPEADAALKAILAG